MAVRVLLVIGAACLIMATGLPAAADVGMQYVPIGNPGNADDIHYEGWGGVDYVYQIGKYEVTNAQYRQMLNAVAAVGDSRGLYNTGMRLYGIARSGSGTVSDPYVYTASGGDSNWDNRPINYVSLWDACRFANWMHNGQPTGPQDDTTTEDGAYTLTPEGIADNTVTRNPGARVWIPREDEWYKAAYYDPALNGGGGGYYDYPMGSDAVPDAVRPEDDTGNAANFGHDQYGGGFGPAVGGPYYTTEVGAYALSASPYGTFDQGGNVFEWNDTIPDISWVYDNRVRPNRVTRGGALDSYWYELNVITRYRCAPTNPHSESNIKGFRVAAAPAAVPEPGALVLVASAGLAMLRRRRKAGT